MKQNDTTGGDFPTVLRFHILKAGEPSPSGPLSQIQVEYMIANEHIKASDFIFYPEANGWRRVSEVFQFPQEAGLEFSQDGQDREIVAESYKFIKERTLKDENLHYIAVQDLPALSLTAAVRLTMPKSIVVTDRRICIVEPKLVGKTTCREFPFQQLKNGLKQDPKPGANTGTFVFVLLSGEWLEVPKIPGAQLVRLEEIVQGVLAQSKTVETKSL